MPRVWHCARFRKAAKSVMSMTVSMGSFIVSHPFRPEHYPVVYFITPENEVLTHILPACATEQKAGDAARAAFDLIRTFSLYFAAIATMTAGQRPPPSDL